VLSETIHSRESHESTRDSALSYENERGWPSDGKIRKRLPNLPIENIVRLLHVGRNTEPHRTNRAF
jgi:hypothetical protein